MPMTDSKQNTPLWPKTPLQLLACPKNIISPNIWQNKTSTLLYDENEESPIPYNGPLAKKFVDK